MQPGAPGEHPAVTRTPIGNGNPLPIGVRVTAGCSPGAPGCIIARTADTVAGNYNPDFVMEFSSSLRWKRLTLATTVSWQQGGSVADMTRTLWDEGGTSRDYDDPITRETMGDGWNLNAPPSYTNPSTGITYPYTQGP